MTVAAALAVGEAVGYLTSRQTFTWKRLFEQIKQKKWIFILLLVALVLTIIGIFIPSLMTIAIVIWLLIATLLLVWLFVSALATIFARALGPLAEAHAQNAETLRAAAQRAVAQCPMDCLATLRTLERSSCFAELQLGIPGLDEGSN